MHKFNKIDNYLLIISFILVCEFSPINSLYAQFAQRNSSTGNRSQSSGNSSSSGSRQSNTSSQGSGGGSQSSSGSGSSGSSGGAGSSGSSGSSGGSSSGSQSSGIKVFDPFLDNHLKAPPDGITVGKFGRTIKQVEEELRLLGAKHYSYAFGKYSKMILSSYQITLSFDVNKRLGMVEIVPKPPLKTIEMKAQDFFIKLFTEGADMSQVGILLSSNKLELKFISPDDDIKYKMAEQQNMANEEEKSDSEE